MATKTAKETNEYVVGEDLLKKAIIAEKDSRRYHGMYIQWVQQYGVPVEVIVDQLMRVKFWALSTARKHAKSIILLGEPANKEHLEALLNGEISFEVACLRVLEFSNQRVVYNDEETALRYLQRAFTIMLHRNKTWASTEMMSWVQEVFDKFSALKK